jgi:phenylacetyl-CoA:acceptor oxidoreductase subunit 2
MRGVTPWHQTPWDWRAAIQFICGGAGAGLLLFTALAALENEQWLKHAGGLALVLLTVGLFSVWIKLGRRWRFLLVFRNPWTSWMSREALFSLPMMGLGLIGVLFFWPPIALIAALFGMGYLYSQAQILKASRAIPAWREPLIVPLIVVTGLAEGAALFLIANAALQMSDQRLVLVLVLLLLLARLWIWTRYRQKVTAPEAAPADTVAVLDRMNQPLALFGHFLPLILLLLTLFVPSAATIFGLLAGLAALAAGGYLKFMLIARVAYNQGFAIVRTPARTPGYSDTGTKPGWN